MLNIKKHLKSKIYRKTFICIFVLFLLPVCIFAAITYENMYSTEKQQTIAGYSSAAESASALLDKEFELINDIKIQLFSSKWISRQMTDRDIVKNSDILKQVEYCEQLKKLIESDRSFKECTVFFPEDELVICSNWLSSFDYYLEYINRVYGIQLSEDTFHSLDARTDYIVNGNVCIVIFNLEISLSPRGYGIVVIDNSVINNNLKALLPNAQLTISNKVGGEFPINKELPEIGYSIDQNASQADFTYHFQFPSNIGVPYHQLIIFILTISLSLVLSIVLSCLVAYIIYTPLYKLFYSAKNAEDDNTAIYNNEYQLIQSVINNTTAENAEMKRQVESYKPVLKNEFLRCLLKGSFSSQKEIQGMLRMYEINFNNELFYSTVIIKIIGFNENMDESAKVFSILSAFCRTCNAEFLESFLDEYIVIFSSPNPNTDIDVLIYDIRKLLEPELHKQINFFKSEFRESIIGISISFQSTKLAMFNSNATTKPPLHQTEYYFPFDWEVQLSDSIFKGDERTVRRILYQMVLENQKKDLLSKNAEQIVDLVIRLTEHSISQISSSHIVEATIREQILKADGEERWHKLVDFVANMTIELSKQRTGENYLKSLKQYVDKNYCSSTMSLKELCDKFNMSESMVSKTFKDEANENFYGYLTQKRMSKAKELLLSRCYDIQTIAAMIGYDNKNSFNRAFVRHEGVKPSEYIHCDLKFKSE